MKRIRWCQKHLPSTSSATGLRIFIRPFSKCSASSRNRQLQQSQSSITSAASSGAMLWHVLRENRPPQSDLHCGTADFADHSLVGVLVQSILAGSRGFHVAVPGPGRLGCNSSSLERTLASGCSGHVPGFYLSTWKSVRRRKCNNPGGSGRRLGWQLCPGLGDRGRYSSDCRILCHRVRSRSERRHFLEAGCHGLS